MRGPDPYRFCALGGASKAHWFSRSRLDDRLPLHCPRFSPRLRRRPPPLSFPERKLNPGRNSSFIVKGQCRQFLTPHIRSGLSRAGTAAPAAGAAELASLARVDPDQADLFQSGLPFSHADCSFRHRISRCRRRGAHTRRPRVRMSFGVPFRRDLVHDCAPLDFYLILGASHFLWSDRMPSDRKP